MFTSNFQEILNNACNCFDEREWIRLNQSIISSNRQITAQCSNSKEWFFSSPSSNDFAVVNYSCRNITRRLCNRRCDLRLSAKLWSLEAVSGQLIQSTSRLTSEYLQWRHPFLFSTQRDMSSGNGPTWSSNCFYTTNIGIPAFVYRHLKPAL